MGDIGDTIKAYTDNDSQSTYDAYKMECWMETNTFKTEVIPLTVEIVGTQFLNGIQKMTVQSEKPDVPESGFTTIFSIADKNETFLYFFHENGKIYTEQYGKRYYLGEDTFQVHWRTMTFTTAAINILTPAQGGVPKLPIFDHTNIKLGNTVKREDASKLLKTFSSDYHIACTATNYAEQETPVLISDKSNKEYILDLINSSQEVVNRSETMGAGLIIRIFNESECYNFMITSNGILNYQVDNNDILFKIPDETFKQLQYILAIEVAQKLK